MSTDHDVTHGQDPEHTIPDQGHDPHHEEMEHENHTDERPSRSWLPWAIGGGVLVVAVIIFLMSWEGPFKKPSGTTTDSASTTTTQMVIVQGLVLRQDCYTPCSANINYPFVIMRFDPLKIKWQGVEGWIEYPQGTWDLKAPSTMRSGQTLFASPDSNKQVRVQVYQNTTGKW